MILQIPGDWTLRLYPNSKLARSFLQTNLLVEQATIYQPLSRKESEHFCRQPMTLTEKTQDGNRTSFSFLPPSFLLSFVGQKAVFHTKIQISSYFQGKSSPNLHQLITFSMFVCILHTLTCFPVLLCFYIVLLTHMLSIHFI